jgi:hypothetical protein
MVHSAADTAFYNLHTVRHGVRASFKRVITAHSCPSCGFQATLHAVKGTRSRIHRAVIGARRRIGDRVRTAADGVSRAIIRT